MGILDDYKEEIYNKIQDKENIIDKYEDKLGTYLMQLTGKSLTENQTKQISVLLHTLSDFERIGDHAVNISKSANELYEKKFRFSDEARHELKVLGDAVREVLDLTVESFSNDDLVMAAKIEPLRALIGMLCDDLKSRHIARLREGKCEMKQGFAFNNILTDYERIGAHCSNVAVAMIEAAADGFDTHEYLKGIRDVDNHHYLKLFEEYVDKYSI